MYPMLFNLCFIQLHIVPHMPCYWMTTSNLTGKQCLLHSPHYAHYVVWKISRELITGSIRVIQLLYRHELIKDTKIENITLQYHTVVYFSSHHSFSFRTCSSSAGVKSFLILNVFLISSGVFPLIMLATVLHVTSNKPLMSR